MCALAFTLPAVDDKIDKAQADVAQLVEQPIRNRQVTGSSPVVGSRSSDAERRLPRNYYLRFILGAVERTLQFCPSLKQASNWVRRGATQQESLCLVRAQ